MIHINMTTMTRRKEREVDRYSPSALRFEGCLGMMMFVRSLSEVKVESFVVNLNRVFRVMRLID